MQPERLSTLILQSLPLETIVEQKLLDEALSPSDLKIMQDRFTLENLKDEGLLTKDLDPMTFYLALENAAPRLIWMFIDCSFINDRQIPECGLLSRQGLEWLKQARYTLEEVKEEVSRALTNLLSDFLGLVEEPGVGLGFDSNTRLVDVICDYFDGKYRLFVNRIIGSSYIEYGPSNNLDELIADMFNALSEANWSGHVSTMIEKISTISDVLRRGYDCFFTLDIIKQQTEKISKELWEERKVIETDGYIELSLKLLSRFPAKIRVIGNFLHIFYENGGHEFFSKEDGDGIIASLMFNPTNWELLPQ